jgi:hypothetical protein
MPNILGPGSTGKMETCPGEQNFGKERETERQREGERDRERERETERGTERERKEDANSLTERD